MNDFSLLVRKKIEALDSEQKLMFDEEYNRRKKPLGDDFNSDLAMEILRDISLTFENINPIQKNNEKEEENFSKRKTSENTSYLPPKKKSNRSYLFNFIYVLILGFIGISAYTKPTKVKMENDIINKFLETQPQFVSFFKNVFLGEEVTEEKADALIYNLLKSNGYEIYFKDSDFWIIKKLEIVDEVSDKTLLVAYGFLGKTFVIFKADDLVIDFNKNNKQRSSNLSKEPKKYEKIKDLDYDPDYWKKLDKPNFNENREYKTPNLIKKKEGLQEIKNEPKEDSIKI